MKDLLKKMSQLEASAPKAPPKKKILKESAPAQPVKVEPKNMSLKDMFRQLDEAMAPGQKPLPVLDPTNKKAGMGVVTSQNPAVSKMLSNLDPQDVQVVMTQQQPMQGQQKQQGNQAQQGGATMQTSSTQAVQEEELDEKWGGDTELNPSKKGMFKGKTKAELEKQLAALHKSGPHKKGSPEYTKQQELNFAIRAKGAWKKGVKEGDIPSASGVDTYGAALGAGRSRTTLEAKKAKPDFLDLDKDGDKKESMKKAAADKKKAVKENMSNRIRAARLEGKSHGLKGHSYAGKNYEDMEECRAYHEGYKEGLDECYGMMDECYGMATPHMPATTHGMADQAARDPYTGEMDEGNAFTAGLARTPHGGKFTVGGKSFTDTSHYDSHLGEEDFAFEAWDRELENLINEGKQINESKKSSKKSLTEGLTVSVSKGQQGAPDSVNISATDAEADQVLALVRQAGLGIFGGEGGHEELSDEPRGFSIQAPSSEVNTPGDIEVVDDNDGMLGLMKKLSGIQHDGDDAGEGEEAECENCGMPESECECDEGKLDEVESEDQMSYEMAEDEGEPQQGQSPAQPQNPSDNGAANSQNATKGNSAANNAAAGYDASQKEENGPQENEEVDEAVHPDTQKAWDEHFKRKKSGPYYDEDGEDEEDEPDYGKQWYDTSKELDEEDDLEEGVNGYHQQEIKDKMKNNGNPFDNKPDNKLDEWANNARRNNDEDWEADIEFMTKVISGGLNKPKSTGQTTIPVVAGQDDRMHSHLNTKDINESASDWAKLAGIRK